MKDFPLGTAMSYSCWRMNVAYCSIIFTFGIFATATCAFASTAMDAAASTQTMAEAAEYLAGKPISYWLIGLALFTGASFTAIVKWLLTQLELQRTANQASSSALLQYMKDDRAMLVQQLEKVATIVSENSRVIQQAEAKFSITSHGNH